MIIKKLVKPISRIGIANVIEQEYSGVAPINVDNATKQISIDTSNFATLNGSNTFTGANSFTRDIIVGYGQDTSQITFDGGNTINLINDNLSMKFSYIPTQDNLVDNSIPVWKNVKNETNAINSKVDENITNIEAINTELENVSNEVDTLRNDLGDLGNQVNTNTNSINTLTPKVDTNTQNIATNTQNITTNTDNINTINATLNNCAKLDVMNAYTGTSQANYHLSNSISDYVIRFQCDSFSATKTLDLLRVHRAGAKAGTRLKMVNSTVELEHYGPTTILDMKDPTSAGNGANKRYVDSQISTTNDRITNLIATKTLTLSTSPSETSNTTNNWYNKVSNGHSNTHLFGFEAASLPDNIRNNIINMTLHKDDNWRGNKAFVYNFVQYENELKLIVHQLNPLTADDAAYYNGMIVEIRYLNI